MTAPGAASSAALSKLLKPKRPQSAYFLFANDFREQVIKQLKSEGIFKFGDVAKQLSSRWAVVSDEEKRAYEEKASADKQRYAEEFRAYLEANDPVGMLHRKYAHLMPTRPLAAAALYHQDAVVRAKAEEKLREDGQEVGPKQVDTKVKEMWKAAGEEERRPFDDRAGKEKAEFLQKQQEWHSSPEFKAIEAAEKVQKGRAKAGKAEEAEKESAKTPAKRARKAKVAAETPTLKTAPVKRKLKEQVQRHLATASATKRARRSAHAGIKSGMPLDGDVIAEAATLKLEAALRNLAARPDVVASGKESSDLLDALRASGGLVNPARRALLGQA